MENLPQNPEFRINSENFHPCRHNIEALGLVDFMFSVYKPMFII